MFWRLYPVGGFNETFPPLVCDLFIVVVDSVHMVVTKKLIHRISENWPAYYPGDNHICIHVCGYGC